MAAARNRTTVPVGSKQWVANERQQISQFEDQENEDFAFSARNEFDWLNEHMAEIFSNNQINVTEIFKTPGKLRGKTPRTARKRNPLEARAPLTDVFASDLRYNASPVQQAEKEGKRLRIQSPLVAREPNPASPAPQRANLAYHKDSGYHGSTQDEMDVETLHQEQKEAIQLEIAMDIDNQSNKPSNRTTEDSFHSAPENITTNKVPASHAAIPGAFPRDTPMPSEEPAATFSTIASNAADAMQLDKTDDRSEEDLNASPSSSEAPTPAKGIVRKNSLNFASLPPREPLATKKSIGQRDSRVYNIDKRSGPLGDSYFGRFNGGKSIGISRQQEIDDQEAERSLKSHPEREHLQGDTKSHSKSSTQRLHERITLLGKAPAPKTAKPTSSSVLDSASEQPGYPDLSKSVANLEPSDEENTTEAPRTIGRQAPEEDDDEWIVPPTTNSYPSRPQLFKSRSVDVMEKIDGKDSIGGEQLGFGAGDRDNAKLMSPTRMDTIRESGQHPYAHQKSISTTVLPSPSRMESTEYLHQKAVSVSNPTFQSLDSTTPAGSPSKFHLEGHLSASKSKLQSIMKSARGLFTSSGGVSAQAKLEALSPPLSRMRAGTIDEVIYESLDPTTELYPRLQNGSHATLSESPANGRKLRNSVDKAEKRKEKEARDRERAEAELAKAREKERQKAKEFREKEEAKAAKGAALSTLENTSKSIRQSPRRAAKEAEVEAAEEFRPAEEMAPPAKAPASTQKKDVRRVAKPTAKPKPPQVAIRVGTMSQRIPLTNSALSSTLHDTLSASAAKQPGLNKKPSNASIQTSASSASFKSSTSSKPKSLVAAAQKKEQAEKEAQRRDEEKRERERKRAAAQEEAQRKEKEQRQREESERQKERERVAAEEAKRKAQKEAADKKRLEMSKKAQAELAKKVQEQKRAMNELAQAQQAGTIREVSRPPSRMDKLEDFPKPPSRPINPAKAPIKRVFDPDNDDELTRPARPTAAGQNYQANQDKRRRTEDEDDFRPISRPTLQPPIRQSNVIKVKHSISHEQHQPFGHSTNAQQKGSIFHSNYPAVPQPAASNTQQSYKQGGLNVSYQQQQHVVQAQSQQFGYGAQSIRPANPMDMAKYQNGKIPFADASSAQYKTPMAAQKSAMPSTAKTRSSPGAGAFGTNGDHIHLDEIETESESDDSEDERQKKRSQPDWVSTPVLFGLLGRQEELNPDAVFGPIGPLNMEEMFRDKSRHGKFRARTSSANWNGPDRLTEDDIRNDLAARDKLRRDGGWSFRLGESSS